MDQRELVRSLEKHFRKEEEAVHEQRKLVHEERSAQSDEEWWNDLIEKTKGIRPQMLEIFERNKGEMIARRFQTISAEEGFREKMIQRRAMELLPYVSAHRSEIGSNGDLTSDEIYVATMRKNSEVSKSAIEKFEAGKDKIENPKKRALIELFIEDAKVHRAEMDQFMDPKNLTEEAWEEHSKRLTERMEVFLERTEEIAKRDPEELN